MQAQPVRVIVRLPYNRPEHPFPDPIPVSWTSDKEGYLWEVVAKSRGSESGAPDWKALATRLDVPLPYLLYRAQVRYEQDLRGLQVVKGSLSPPGVQGGLQHSEGSPGAGDSPNPRRNSVSSHRDSSLAKLATSIRLTTPLGVRARLNSLSSNSPSRMNRPSSSSVLTLRGQRRDQAVFRPGTPLSSESETDEEDDRQEEAERRLEEQEALDKKLKNLQTLLTGENVGLVSFMKENRKEKSPKLKDVRSSQSISSASSPRGSIPSIPSPPPESSQSLTSRHIAPAKSAASPSATSPGQGTKTQPLLRYGPSVKATPASSASSFSDLSEASLNSELESAFSSNIRAGGSRL
ncbi:hypothetical protein EDB92DRAFT_1932502 [Lactarius akahatsu]|uniref:Autophagy-related protein 29 n=1 Tax=Lactarius akahatsu TaxID=416441 RepID=A0AAD4LQJ9_9AGAM|nr:hypothetical protein EDB92DRAFT_1932502 [Lactarius akahatsu]